MGYNDGAYNINSDTTIPRHMICKICGKCSTALNPQRICWRHEEYKNGQDGAYYLGKLEEDNGKKLPTPVENGK